MRELAAQGLVWFPHDQLLSTRSGILRAFRQAGCPIEIVQDPNRTMTTLACVAAGYGVSLQPRSVKALQFSDVRLCEIPRGDALPLFEMNVIWPARTRSTLADRCVDLITPSLVD
jgi:DNA-binding transcriptional LysR family regulator